MISISEAIKIIKRETSALAPERVALNDSVGRVLAENVSADMDLPPFDRSQMDGFAVRAGDVKNAPVKLKIIGESVAGKGFDGELNSGEAVRIMTGARVPAGADSVQKVELTSENDGFVEIKDAAKPRLNINTIASEVEKGALIFSQGEIVTAEMVAAIASFGYAELTVFRQPKISILSTGSEIVAVSETPQKDQIRNSNSVMLEVFAKKLGLKTQILPMVHDDYETLKNQIAAAVGMNPGMDSRFQIPDSRFQIPDSKLKSKSGSRAAKSEIQSGIRNLESGILIITGGVSVGDYDFTKPVLRELGAEIFFEKISLKPGKPTVFARLGDTLVFGLPGNPVSVAVTFQLFARTAILKMQSARNCELKKGFAVASGKIKSAKERDCYLPVSLETDEKGTLMIESLRFSGSSNFIAFARADALVFVPRGVNLEAGDVAEVLFL